MHAYQSLQKDSQSLQNPAEMRFYWNLAVLKSHRHLHLHAHLPWGQCQGVQVDHGVS
jgi:hypothetical protein